MSHQITVNLSDDEYAALSQASQMSGRPVEELVRETVTRRFPTQPEPSAQLMTEREVEEYLYRTGFTSNLPTHEPDTPEEEAEDEEVAKLLSKGKSLTQMIIEDRGPY